VCLAIPGKIISAEDEGSLRIGRVQFGGVMQPVSLDFVPEAQVGDYVLVHVGFALAVINAEEAALTYRALEQMGMLEGELPQSQETVPEGDMCEIPG
jgi:hydrogenase expression/formation protein HypC